MIAQSPFGGTGHFSSRTLLGAAAFGQTTQAETDATLELALSLGVNHVDTAASYGESELRIGSWIRRHGKAFFLATKTGERRKQAARDELHRSLERLGVDQVDLLQLHNLVDPQEWETALGPGGALEAAIAAREEGLVRFIGVTGHGVTVARMHLRALDRFAFDSVLAPFSYVLNGNAEYAADVQALRETCRTRGVAMQTIKSIVKAPWDGRPQTRSTWYEPLEDQADIDLAVHWVLGHSDVFLNTVGDIQVLPRVLAAAARFSPAPAEADLQAMVARQGMLPLFV
ncbi:MAG: aldo/keto reductase [Anaerolineales bacterium]|nr:aldo/keto reductase [Anaerolineales bacterium]